MQIAFCAQLHHTDLEKQFREHEKQYKLHYASPAERNFRKSLFAQNLTKLDRLKKWMKQRWRRMFGGRKSALPVTQIGPSQFSTLTSEERSAYLTPAALFQRMNKRYAVPEDVYRETQGKPGRRSGSGLRRFIARLRGRQLHTTPFAPSRVDWRMYAMWAVDQGKCMGCYAFSTIALLAANYHIATGKALRFSVQELIDCSLENWGCVAGVVVHAMNYIIEHGITFSHYYPFRGAATTSCQVELPAEYIQRYANREMPRAFIPDSILHTLEPALAPAPVPSSAASPQMPRAPSAFPQRVMTAKPVKRVLAATMGPIQPMHASTFTPLQRPSQPMPPQTPRISRPPLPTQPIDYAELLGTQHMHQLPKFYELVGYYFLKPGILNLIDAVGKGPVAVIFFVSEGFLHYKAGTIFMGTDCPPDAQPDHAVVIVGYDFTGPVPYFIFQNSWGPNWHEEGFGMIYTGIIAEGEYGICSMAATDTSVVPIFAEAF